MKLKLYEIYLAYTKLILVYKIDPIALTMTSKFIDPGAYFIRFLFCYAVLAFIIHFPASVFRDKKKK